MIDDTCRDDEVIARTSKNAVVAAESQNTVISSVPVDGWQSTEGKDSIVAVSCIECEAVRVVVGKARQT